jgi:hypothetical protein
LLLLYLAMSAAQAAPWRSRDRPPPGGCSIGSRQTYRKRMARARPPSGRHVYDIETRPPAKLVAARLCAVRQADALTPLRTRAPLRAVQILAMARAASPSDRRAVTELSRLHTRSRTLSERVRTVRPSHHLPRSPNDGSSSGAVERFRRIGCGRRIDPGVRRSTLPATLLVAGVCSFCTSWLLFFLPTAPAQRRFRSIVGAGQAVGGSPATKCIFARIFERLPFRQRWRQSGLRDGASRGEAAAWSASRKTKQPDRERRDLERMCRRRFGDSRC